MAPDAAVVAVTSLLAPPGAADPAPDALLRPFPPQAPCAPFRFDPALGALMPAVQSAPPPPAAPLPPVSPVGHTMTAAAAGRTREQFLAAGWTDDQLIAQGYMIA
jgi:hypothetical protein